MKITEFSVRRYQFTIVTFLMMVALGVTSLMNIPMAEDPSLNVPSYVVAAVYPGASPIDMEHLVAEKIESALKELDDLKTIKTDVEDGVCVVNVEFYFGSDPDAKYNDVLRQVNAVRNDLPAGLQRLDVTRITTSDVNIAQVALVSEHASYQHLDECADQLKKRLEIIPGVKRSSSWAIPEREVGVALDLQKLSRTGVPLNQVLGIVQASNVNIPGGSVDIGRRKFNITSGGEYESVEQVAQTIIGAGPAGVVRLADVATVELRDAELSYYGRYNGQRAVFVTASQKEHQQIFRTSAEVDATLKEFAATLPPGITLERGFDQSKNVAARLNGLSKDLILAIGLVLLTLLPLGTRASVVVMISIPLSLAMGFALLYLTGFSLNQLSIAGAVVALGLLVDDSIVVTENIARFIRNGRKPVEAAIDATKQIGVAVLGTTATLIFAFVPLLFLPGAPGEYIRSLPASVIFTVIASLVVAFTIIPFLASRLLRSEEDPEGNRIYRVTMGWIHRTYRPVLEGALKHPWRTIGIASALFLGSLALLPVVGFSLFPKAGIPQFHVTVKTPEGSSLTETEQATLFVERILRSRCDLQYVFTNIGGGNPQVYYNVARQRERATVGHVFAELSHFDPGTTPSLFDSLRAVFASYPNAVIQLKEFENGPPLDAPIAIRVLGENLDTLRLLAGRVERLLEETPGTQYIDNPLKVMKTDVRIAVDRDRAGMVGVQTAEIDRTVRLAVAGLQTGSFRTREGDEYPIVIRSPRNKRQSMDALDRISVGSATGAQVPLRQLGVVTFESSPGSITRYNKERSITVTAYTRTGYNTDRVTKDVLARLEKERFPSGYRTMAAGEIESRQESFGGMGTAITVAIFAIFAILVLEFGTFRSTLIVLSVIPLGVIGGILALLFTGNTLSFTAIIGFVALVGIEVKNSILLVDFTNQLREEGMDVDRAIAQAGEIRFFPILLTTMTALGGLLPLALQDSALYSPLAWVIIGGLVTSTILTRVVTPVMYKVFAPAVARHS